MYNDNPTKEQLRAIVRDRLDDAVTSVNQALQGQNLKDLDKVLARVGRGKQRPHWYNQLEQQGTLPNLDGKTIGSVVEMLFLAVLEKRILAEFKVGELSINPARGIDIPDLDLGVKSPSENYCTSEPFFSPYERLMGSEYDAVVFLTDYQSKKRHPPLNLQIIKSAYLSKTEIADVGLCSIARLHREALIKENESWAKRFFRFLAFVNQSDWLARQLIKVAAALYGPDNVINGIIETSKADFDKKNTANLKKGKELIADEDWESLARIKDLNNKRLAIIDAIDNWVVATYKDFGRVPSEGEWRRLKSGPLDGKIGMSYALQWRYNFGRLFNGGADDIDIDLDELLSGVLAQ